MSEGYTTEELRQEFYRLDDRTRHSDWTWKKLAAFALGNAERAEAERQAAVEALRKLQKAAQHKDDYLETYYEADKAAREVLTKLKDRT